MLSTLDGASRESAPPETAVTVGPNTDGAHGTDRRRVPPGHPFPGERLDHLPGDA